MKRTYGTPEIQVRSFVKENILTDSEIGGNNTAVGGAVKYFEEQGIKDVVTMKSKD